jgi:ABC-type methionine transport system ATPase subunit
MTEKLRLTFLPPRSVEPVVCRMAKKFEIEFSIRRANIGPDSGWMDLSIEGEEAEIERAIHWLENDQNVQVGPAGGDVVEG